VFLGGNDPKHLTGWNGAFWEQFRGVDGQEFPPIMQSYTAIRLYGAGHVVAHNYVADFHDGIDTEMYGMPDGSHAHDHSIEMDGKAGSDPGSFATLLEYAAATGQDRHSVMVDYDVFVRVPTLTRDPATVQRLYDFKDVDFRLTPGGAAIDRGVVLANVNAGFTGKAPDLGALEAGQPLPVYGPGCSFPCARPKKQ
jgi:hypothetical protein